MKKKGMGILVSTHLLTMAEQYCERFVFLHNGKIEPWELARVARSD